MHIETAGMPWELNKNLLQIFEDELNKAGITKDVGGILTFRDPDFSPESGGFHPVEVAVGPGGRIEYITDFAYFGMPPHCELAKELDYDFSLGLFQHFGVEFPIEQGYELFKIWQVNFLSYHSMGVYSLSIEPMG